MFVLHTQGMKRFIARKEVLQALREKGLYRETKDNPMVVPICRSVTLQFQFVGVVRSYCKKKKKSKCVVLSLYMKYNNH